MKKILFLLAVGFLSASAFQYNARLYVGAGGGSSNEKLTNLSPTPKQNAKTQTSSFASVKFGYGDIRAYAVEVVVNYADNKSDVFSADDKAQYGADIMFIKAFNFTDIFYPYLCVGIGAGEMKITKDSINNREKSAYSSTNYGAGIFVPVFGSFDLELRYLYKYTAYQSIKEGAKTYKPKSHKNQLYFGVNYRF